MWKREKGRKLSEESVGEEGRELGEVVQSEECGRGGWRTRRDGLK